MYAATCEDKQSVRAGPSFFINIPKVNKVQLQRQHRPHWEHLTVGHLLGLKNCVLGSVGSSLDEMRYLTIVMFVNSVLHPPHSQIRLSGQRLSTCKY